MMSQNQYSSVHIQMKLKIGIQKIFKDNQNKDEPKVISEHRMFGRLITEIYQTNIKIYRKI